MSDLGKKLVEATVAGFVGVGVAWGTGVLDPTSLVGAFVVAFAAKYSSPQAVLK